jgi:hypothetical protein
LIALAGGMNQHQQHAIAYLVEENRVLREQIGRRRLKFTDEQRRRLAAKAKIVGAKWLSQIAIKSCRERIREPNDALSESRPCR